MFKVLLAALLALLIVFVANKKGIYQSLCTFLGGTTMLPQDNKVNIVFTFSFGSHRVAKTLELLETLEYDTWIISVSNDQEKVSEHIQTLRSKFPAVIGNPRVVVDSSCASTAEEVALLSRYQGRSILMVSDEYHMWRIKKIANRLLVKSGPLYFAHIDRQVYPKYATGWNSPQYWWVLLSEFLKYPTFCFENTFGMMKIGAL